jgi:hypothetical protein
MGQKVAKLTLLEIDYLPKMKGEYLLVFKLKKGNKIL